MEGKIIKQLHSEKDPTMPVKRAKEEIKTELKAKALLKKKMELERIKNEMEMQKKIEGVK